MDAKIKQAIQAAYDAKQVRDQARTDVQAKYTALRELYKKHKKSMDGIIAMLEDKMKRWVTAVLTPRKSPTPKVATPAVEVCIETLKALGYTIVAPKAKK